MTAAQPLPAPEAVEFTAGAPGADGRANRVIDAYHPEHQFVGSLMWLDAARAQTWTDLVPATAIWRPVARWAYQLIGQLLAAGQDPTPVAVLGAARRAAARATACAEPTPGPARYRQLALYLFDAYAQAVAPAAAIGSYARAVLEEAYRRALHTGGARMQQLAASGADGDELARGFAALAAELADMRSRAQAAAAPPRDPHPAITGPDILRN
jgi:replicative DNA helicase